MVLKASSDMQSGPQVNSEGIRLLNTLEDPLLPGQHL